MFPAFSLKQMIFFTNNRELSIKILQIINKFKIINDARQG